MFTWCEEVLYWFNNLGLITEGNTYLRYTASSLPLWENTDVVLADIKRNSWRRCRGGSSTSTRFLITNLISSQFTLFSIFLSFSSPPLHNKLSFYSPSFSFSFSRQICFSCVILSITFCRYGFFFFYCVHPRERGSQL